jgi:hypothetical protein
LPSIDSIDFTGSTDLPSIDSIDFIGSIDLASIASIDLPSVVRSSDLGSPFTVAALTHTAAPAIVVCGLPGAGACGGRATERERQRWLGSPARCAGELVRRQRRLVPRFDSPGLTPWSDSARSGPPGVARSHSSGVHRHFFGPRILKPDTSNCAALLQLIGNRRV